MSMPTETSRKWSSALHNGSRHPRLGSIAAACLTTLVIWAMSMFPFLYPTGLTSTASVPPNAQHILQQCAGLREVPKVPSDFHSRTVSDRFEPGTPPTLVRNARIFTGAYKGSELVLGDLLLENGIVKAVGVVPHHLLNSAETMHVVDAKRAWVTPGLVDLHSHAGVFSLPTLSGAIDLNSNHGNIQPWLRSIDGFNTHDDAFEHAIAGGITSIQALPASGNAIGGQAFMMKLRKTRERSPSSMLLEPPHQLNGTSHTTSPLRWRHMKQTCGENLRAHGVRMDNVWALRAAYDEARKIKEDQDKFCMNAESGRWDQVKGVFPENLQWEMLIDVLRGRVKISNHCYEAVDFDGIVRLTNEFKFPLASFHHASEAYLVPDLLKKTFGGPPTIALFATQARYKREAYRGSEFAPRVLADSGFPVVMKTDHPMMNTRWLLYEAQQAFYYGLPADLSLASVTSAPAAAAGLDHRIGTLRAGADADVVLWDSHPLNIGAAPTHVWIDGVLQVSRDAVPANDDADLLAVPQAPNWDNERSKTIEHEGLPPLTTDTKSGWVVFRNVTGLFINSINGEYQNSLRGQTNGQLCTVVVFKGRIVCADFPERCLPPRKDVATQGIDIIDADGGSIWPAMMSYGSPIGIEEIQGEPSTANGDPFLVNIYATDPPDILESEIPVIRAADALQFQTRNALIAHRAGVTYGTTSLALGSMFGAPSISPIGGLSTTFRTGSAHALESGAIVKNFTALHVSIGREPTFAGVFGLSFPFPSVSSQIMTLRKLLLEENPTHSDEEGKSWFTKASRGELPLVIDVANADIMATLIQLKHEVDAKTGKLIRMVFAGAGEAHLLAEEIASAKIGVILRPARPMPGVWEGRRILAGPPITNDTAVLKLLDHGVVVGLGVEESWDARNLRWEAAIAVAQSGGRLNERRAYHLVSGALDALFGLEQGSAERDLLVFKNGSPFKTSAKLAAVISPAAGVVELL